MHVSAQDKRAHNATIWFGCRPHTRLVHLARSLATALSRLEFRARATARRRTHIHLVCTADMCRLNVAVFKIGAGAANRAVKHSPVIRITTPCACIACSVSTRNTLPNSLLSSVAAAAAEWCGERHSRTCVCTDAQTHERSNACARTRTRTHARVSGGSAQSLATNSQSPPRQWWRQEYPSVPNNRQKLYRSKVTQTHIQICTRNHLCTQMWQAVANDD